MSTSEQADRIQSLIFQVGDKGWLQVKNNLYQLVSVLEKDYNEHQRIIVDSILTASIELPFKSSTYATLTALLNAKIFDIGVDVVLAVGNKLQASFDSQQYRDVKNLLRFTAELTQAKVITSNSFFSLLETIVIALNASEHSGRNCTVAYVVLSTMIWLNNTYILEHQSQFDHILEKLTSCLDCWIEGELSPIIKLWPESPSSSKTQYLWQVIQYKKHHLTEDSMIASPHKWFMDDLIDSVPVPESNSEAVYPYQGEQLFLFVDEMNTEEHKKHQLPLVHSVDRFVFSDYVSDMISLYSHNHKFGSKFLLLLPDYVNTELFDELEYNHYEAIVEGLLLNIIRLPKANEKEIYYTALLFDVFVAASSKVPSAVGKCIRSLFDSMEAKGMDLGAVKRFGEWFAHHLSNFGFVWKWNEWEYVIQEGPEHMKFVFVREVLERCVRLTYYERIKSAITEEYVDGKIFALEGPKVNFRFAETTQEVDATLQDLVTKLLLQLKTKGALEDVESQLEEIKEYARRDLNMDGNAEGKQTPEDLAHDALIQTIMMTGSKSFSHLLHVIEKNLAILEKYNETPELMMKSVKSIASFWKDHSQFMDIVFDKMMGYRIVSPEIVIQWAIQEMNTHPTRWFLWDIVYHTLNKSNLKVFQTKTISLKNDTSDFLMAESKEESVKMDTDSDWKMDLAVRDQKKIYVYAMQQIADLLNKKLSSMEDDVLDSKWWACNSGFMIDLGRKFMVEYKAMQVTVESLAFTSDTDARILAIWQELTRVYQKQM